MKEALTLERTEAQGEGRSGGVEGGHPCRLGRRGMINSWRGADWEGVNDWTVKRLKNKKKISGFQPVCGGED